MLCYNPSPSPPLPPKHATVDKQTKSPSNHIPAFVGLLVGGATASIDRGCCGDREFPPPPPPPNIIGCGMGGGAAAFFTSVLSIVLSLLCRPLTGESSDAWSDSSAPNIFLHSGFWRQSLILEIFEESDDDERIMQKHQTGCKTFNLFKTYLKK